MGKKVLSLALVLAFVFSLAACATKSSESNVPSTTSSESSTSITNQAPVEISIQWWGDVNRNKKFEGLMRMFEVKNPNIKVQSTYSPFGEYWDKLNIQTASGNGPDVFLMTPFEYGKYASKGIMADLKPYVDDKTIDLSGWDKKVLDMGTYNNTFVMLNIGMTVSSLIINRTSIEKLGITIPTEDMSWSQMSDFTKQVQSKLSKNQYAMFDASGIFDFFVVYLLEKGKTISNMQEDSLGFDATDAEEYMTWWDNLRKEGTIPPKNIAAEEGAKPVADSMLVQKTAMMILTNSNQLPQFQAVMPDDTLDILRCPALPTGKSVYGEAFNGVFLAMPTTTKNPKAAATLINWWANDIEANKVYNFEHGVLGSSKVTEALISQVGPEVKKVIEISDKIMKTAPAMTYRPTAYNAITTAFSAATDAIGFGKKSIKQASADFIVDAKKELLAAQSKK